MTKNKETEIKTALNKTVAFLMEETNTLSQNTAVEILGKSEDEIRTILNSAMTDFWNMGLQYFVQEITKKTSNQQWGN